ELVGFAAGAYRRRSQDTSALLRQLFERFQGEGLTMSFTMEDFRRQYVMEHFAQLTPEEQRESLERLSPEHRREALQLLPPEELLAALSAEQIRKYLDQLAAGRQAQPRKPRQKK